MQAGFTTVFIVFYLLLLELFGVWWFCLFLRQLLTPKPELALEFIILLTPPPPRTGIIVVQHHAQ